MGSYSSATASTTRRSRAADVVGIAMGSGADVALETADVTLLYGGLTPCPAPSTWRPTRCGRCVRILGWRSLNVWRSLSPPERSIPSSAMSRARMLAAAAMTLSSLSVIANSLRLRGVTSAHFEAV